MDTEWTEVCATTLGEVPLITEDTTTTDVSSHQVQALMISDQNLRGSLLFWRSASQALFSLQDYSFPQLIISLCGLEGEEQSIWTCCLSIVSIWYSSSPPLFLFILLDYNGYGNRGYSNDYSRGYYNRGYGGNCTWTKETGWRFCHVVTSNQFLFSLFLL